MPLGHKLEITMTHMRGTTCGCMITVWQHSNQQHPSIVCSCLRHARSHAIYPQQPANLCPGLHSL